MFYLAGIFITFFLTAVLISKKNKSAADTILAAWLVFIGFHLQLFYLHFSGRYVRFAWLLGLEIPMPLLHGPFLYLYIRVFVQSAKVSPKDLLHFLPFLAGYCAITPFFLLTSAQKITVYQHKGAGFESLSSLIFVSILLSGITYLILGIYFLRRHKERIGTYVPNAPGFAMKWISCLTIGIAVIWIIVMLGNDTLTFASVTAYVLLIGFLGIRQGNIFSHADLAFVQAQTSDYTSLYYPATHFAITPAVVRETAEKIKYQKTALKESEALQIHARLKVMMAKEQFFKNAELTLGDLSQYLGVHQHVLSQVINSHEQKHFYDYINEQRIEAFKQSVQFLQHRKYTLLALAFDCGFNSKTSFNRTFRKLTGISPTEYLAQIETDHCMNHKSGATL